MSPVLKATTDLANRIATVYPSLSNGHRKAADFVLQNPLDTATMTIEGLAEKSGASTATVTRFVRALGYANYGEFRAALSEALKLAMAPVANMVDARSITASPFAALVGALKDEAANIEEAIAGLDETTVTRALAALLKAQRIFVVGMGASHHVASFLEDGLALYLDADVIFAASRGGPTHAMRHMLSAGPDDLVIAISMPRYSRSTVELCNFAKKRGTPVLALTDGLTSPLVPIADFALLAPARNRLLPNSPSAIFALADALVTAVARERPDAVEALKGLSESLLWTFHYQAP
ncbi:MurR/RpiR family transcriptional regulator [Bradyrhizobium sp. LHD-71]|uniref:MurR/RpiR family transcriptional regulator n=1 Tax=Bradyrhizobium sp. LHD-71 TaxID=3072141 RepID=UPI00280E489C|nr:MurR/RpiR family transcriptional regulator [Bradyrhizobium sp. LHD-71]MDQ8730096.1 MurR/RpiR family transcriptional regulator [Bradyrhizobium sp. LHD-71]